MVLEPLQTREHRPPGSAILAQDSSRRARRGVPRWAVGPFKGSSDRWFLRGTGDAEIVEHTEKDRYWGDGSDGSGQNHFGQTLMRVREESRPGIPVPPITKPA
jgi:hypothetical protein